MFAQTKRGAGAKPLQEKTMSSWGASADRLAPKDLVLTELSLGQRGAITMEFDVNYRKTKIK